MNFRQFLLSRLLHVNLDAALLEDGDGGGEVCRDENARGHRLTFVPPSRLARKSVEWEILQCVGDVSCAARFERGAAAVEIKRPWRAWLFPRRKRNRANGSKLRHGVSTVRRTRLAGQAARRDRPMSSATFSFSSRLASLGERRLGVGGQATSPRIDHFQQTLCSNASRNLGEEADQGVLATNRDRLEIGIGAPDQGVEPPIAFAIAARRYNLRPAYMAMLIVSPSNMPSISCRLGHAKTAWAAASGLVGLEPFDGARLSTIMPCPARRRAPSARETDDVELAQSRSCAKARRSRRNRQALAVGGDPVGVATARPSRAVPCENNVMSGSTERDQATRHRALSARARWQASVLDNVGNPAFAEAFQASTSTGRAPSSDHSPFRRRRYPSRGDADAIIGGNAQGLRASDRSRASACLAELGRESGRGPHR